MKLKNAPRSSILYAQRALLWNSDSSPYLSGDVFAKASDSNIFPPRFRKVGSLKPDISHAKVLFCPSHKLEDFISLYGKSVTAKVLILGNSDRDFHEPISYLPPSIKKVLCQNLLFDDPRYQVIPIGLENLRLAKNGKMKLFHPRYFSELKQNKILFGPFSLTHAERDGLLGSAFDDDQIVKCNKRMSPVEYAQLSSKFKFVAAPRGNGMDTHRFWETLYRGGIPVVKRSLWSKQISALGIPLMEIDSWNREEILHSINQSSNLEPVRDLPQLWWPWWEKFIRELT